MKVWEGILTSVWEVVLISVWEAVLISVWEAVLLSVWEVILISVWEVVLISVWEVVLINISLGGCIIIMIPALPNLTIQLSVDLMTVHVLLNPDQRMEESGE